MDNRRKRFVLEYLQDLNATQSAIRSGYAPKSAKVTGARLIADANVKLEIDKLMEKRSRQLEFDGIDVMRALWHNHETALAAGDIGQSTRALELCGRHFGNFLDRMSSETHDITVKIYKPDRTLESTNTMKASNIR